MAVFDSAKVPVGKAATKLVALPSACSVYLLNHSTEQVFISSSSSVSVNSGIILPPHIPIVLPVTAAATLYAVCASGTAEVHYLTGA